VVVVVRQKSLVNDGAMIAAANTAKIAAVCHSLDLDAGGKVHSLAGGMTANTAAGLLHDVSKRIGFSVT
jgi:hypothetical protein